MSNFFYNLGRMVGPQVRKANWVYHSLTGTEKDAAQAEYEVGCDLARQLLAELELEPDPAVGQSVQELGNWLARCVKDRQRTFQFYVVRSPEINAFALPGGFIFVTRPLLEFCYWDRDELAFVLGHEMAHVIRGHAIERMMAHSIINAAVRHVPTPGGLLRSQLVQLVTSLLSKGYSQDQELEADRIGSLLTHHAGCDARAGLRLLGRLGGDPGNASVLDSYFSTHPPLHIRLQNIQRCLNKAR